MCPTVHGPSQSVEVGGPLAEGPDVDIGHPRPGGVGALGGRAGSPSVESVVVVTAESFRGQRVTGTGVEASSYPML